MNRTNLILGVAVLAFGAVAVACAADREDGASGGASASGGAAPAGGGTFAGSPQQAGHAGTTVGGRSEGGSTPGEGGQADGAGAAHEGSTGGNSSTPSGGTAGAQTGGSAMAGGAGPVAGDDRSAPILPPITGTCPAFQTGTVTVSGLGGISLEVGPKSPDGGGSLIFYWHGTGSTASEYKTMIPAAVRSEIVGKGGIIVSFQSSRKTGGDCSGTATFSKDDFEVADVLAACAVRDHGIDPRRIYTTGCSAGGLQAGCMAQLRSNYIAAAVPNSGGTVFSQPFQSKSRVPAAMTMHGGARDQVIVAFSQTSATFDASIKDAGGFAVNCNHGGGHCGAPAQLYTAGWQFMKDHPFGASPEPYQSSLPTTFPSYCAKY